MKVPLLNFVGGPGVPLLNFRGVPGSWSHFYTMPILQPLEIIRKYLFMKYLFISLSSAQYK